MNLSCSCINTKEISPIKILAFGNMLVNYTANLEDTQVLDRHRLSLNTKAEMDMDTFSEVASDINVNGDLKVELAGSALHTVRILKQLGTEALFFSACGDDREAAIVGQLLKKDEMDTRVQTIVNAPTGRRISLSHNDSRALYTSSGASTKFSVNYLQFVINEEDSDILRPSNRVQLFYVEGFFVPKREAVTTYIVRNYIQGRRYLALNLSADYIVRQNFNHLLYLVNNSLFVFGNQSEFDVFCECWGAPNVRELAEGIVMKKWSPLVFVVIKGEEGIELITNYLKEGSAPGPMTFQTFNVSQVGDLTKTGDAADVFVAGFLHAWIMKNELSQCIRVGCYYANRDMNGGLEMASYEIPT